ncbi:MAG TPA: putative sulfate exporter family transporter [Bryobacteraceae bacterium]|jgi:uncharacterized membrane protein YadS|nr:putative sulfate exporter family transporter [Bryobacteraceae bacterium]
MNSEQENLQTAAVLKPRPWWSLEDWVPVWAGLILMAAVLMGYRPVKFAVNWGTAGELTNLFSAANVSGWLLLALAVGCLAAVSVAVMGERAKAFVLAFPAVFLLALGSQFLAGNAAANAWGIEYVIFSLALGLLVSSTAGTPEWLLPAVRTEFYIKTGIILMGATIIFGDIMQAGVLGILQSVMVVVVVWYFSFWLARKFHLDDEFATMLSTAVSICGVSAAIAACGAIDGDRRKLSYVSSIVLIVAVPMIVIQPWLIKLFGMPEMVAGAWLGGTLDTTGSVVAAGELIGETATKVGTIVKFSQNVLIGVAALLLSIWWSTRSAAKGEGEQKKVKVSVIWSRFPKFVLGFVGASVIFSFALEDAMVAGVKPILTNLRNVWFSLAFVSIGLETKFTDLLKMEEGRPFWSFLGAQSFNVAWTLLLAWLVFGGVLFRVPQI